METGPLAINVTIKNQLHFILFQAFINKESVKDLENAAEVFQIAEVIFSQKTCFPIVAQSSSHCKIRSHKLYYNEHLVATSTFLSTKN